MTQFNQLAGGLPGDITLRNSTVSTIAAGIAVALTTTAGDMKLTTGATDFFGVTMESIAAGKYGRVRTEGIVVATSGAALATIGTIVKTDNAGKVIAQTAGTAQCGRTMSAAAGANEAVLIKIENAFNA